MQTSPISFVARGEGNRRRLHAGNGWVRTSRNEALAMLSCWFLELELMMAKVRDDMTGNLART